MSSIGTVHAAVERLLNEALPGNTPRPEINVTFTAGGIVELYLDGPETPMFRVLALSLIAATLGDEEGPETIPGWGRYTCGEFGGQFFLVRAPITAVQQAELVEIGQRIADEAGEL